MRTPTPLSEELTEARRSMVYTWAGGLLAAGAPIGLLALRWFQRHRDSATRERNGVLQELREDPLAYLYVAGSTTAAFMIFGYLLGRQADRLAHLSQTDPLTRLYNARALFQRLEAELARSRRSGQPLALLLVDLDGLKQINDRHGHHAGDEALRRLATVIQSEVRETDLAARWGGDEFAVITPDTSQDAALALAERIRGGIASRNRRWPVTASIGVASTEVGAGTSCVDPAMLMNLADRALYEAKRSGRNAVALANGRLPA